MTDEWHYTRGGEQTGPVSWAELKRLADEKTLVATDLVWTESMEEWSEAGKLDGLIPQSPVVRKPPPLPGSVKKAPVAVPTDSKRVTGELYLEGSGGAARSSLIGLKEQIAVLLDQERIGSGTLVDGINLKFESVVGQHSVTLKEEKEVARGFTRGKKFDGVNKSYPVTFDKPGHYDITFLPARGFKAKLGLETLPGSIEIEYTPQVADFVAVSEERRNALVGLWRAVGGSGVAFLFTNDLAMLREDGVGTKFRWSSRDRIELYLDGCEPKADFQILSLGTHELILSTSQGTEHFVRGLTVTEEEVQRRQAEARRQQAEAAANFKNTATGVASLLTSGGFALLCGGVGLGAAAAGAGIGMGAAGSSGASAGPRTPGMLETHCRDCRSALDARATRCAFCGSIDVWKL